jgi:hypothetical protein
MYRATKTRWSGKDLKAINKNGRAGKKSRRRAQGTEHECEHFGLGDPLQTVAMISRVFLLNTTFPSINIV